MTWKTKLKITGPSGSSLHFDGELTTAQKDRVIDALEYCPEPAGKSSAEPFGYFKAEPFGWTDCAETDEGARPLFELATVQAVEKQRDELLAALESLCKTGYSRPSSEAWEKARSAIASVKGSAA